MGSHDLTSVGRKYYNELVTFCETNYVEDETDCIFTRKRCVGEINRRLKESGTELIYNGQIVPFNTSSFKVLLIKENLYDKGNYSERKIDNNREVQYLHSLALIDYVTKKLESNANSIMETLKEEKEECQN